MAKSELPNKILIANWKSNPQTEEEAVALAKASDAAGWVICPPFVFIAAIAGKLKKAVLGAQDVFWTSGPFTGEISPAQLKAFGVQYVIIGHSERRENLGETDEMIGKKMVATLEAGFIPVLCVGESKSTRDAGQAQAVVKRQLEMALAHLQNCDQKLLIAYEPIWAISTSKERTPDNPKDTVSMIGFMQKTAGALCPKMQPQFLYGGSVNSENAASFLSEPKINGALIGGASLKLEEVKKITKIVSSAS